MRRAGSGITGTSVIANEEPSQSRSAPIAAAKACAEPRRSRALGKRGEAGETAAQEIASGESPPNVRFAESVDREALSAAFATGYVGEAFDATSLDLRDYAITIRVENGDLYEFEASHTGTDWQLACCERPKASDLP